jgi:hypothetical protein
VTHLPTRGRRGGEYDEKDPDAEEARVSWE